MKLKIRFDLFREYEGKTVRVIELTWDHNDGENKINVHYFANII